MADTDVTVLADNLVHIGHKSERWNPRMKPFLAGQKDGVHIFDLDQTSTMLDKAKAFLTAQKLANKKVLFVGTKEPIALEIQKVLKGSGHYYVDRKWTPGLLTNFKEIRRRVDYYLSLKSQFESGEISKYTKKEIAKFKKDLDKLEIAYGGVAEMRAKPDVVVVLDAVTDRIAIDEAKKGGAAVMAVADANADPRGIDYIVPGNDDSFKSIKYLLGQFLEALS